MVIGSETHANIRPSLLRWLTCPDQSCFACRTAQVEFIAASLEVQTTVLLTALDLRSANPPSLLVATWSSSGPLTRIEVSPNVTVGAAGNKTINPTYLRWLACPDQGCPACRSAAAEYLGASFDEQTDVLLAALDPRVADQEDTLFAVPSYSGPLVPLGHAPTAGHASTTHRRRRASMLAAMSGVAAAALVVALGLTGGHGKPVVHSALAPIPVASSGGHGRATGNRGAPGASGLSALPPGGIAPAAQLNSINANVTTAAQPVVTGGGTPAPPTSGAGNQGAGNGTTPPAQPTPPPNNSPQPVQSVVSLVTSVPARVVAAVT